MELKMRRFLVGVTAMLVTVGGAHGQETEEGHPYLSDKFSLDVGLFMPQRRVELSVDGPVAGTQGSDVNFRESFGLKKRDDLFALNFAWRFGKKWEFGAQYFESDGQRQRALEEDIEWGEYVFGAGTGVTAGLDFKLIRTFFGRNFDSSDHHNFGVGIGIHYMEIGAFIEGLAILNGQQAGFRREAVSASAPLPNIGAWYVRSLSDRWAVRARFDWFGASIGDYDGVLVNAAAGVNYRLFNNVGLGLSYNFFELDLGMNKNDWRGEVKSTYDGLFIHASVFW
jgi:hypothetical protein